eukprot:g1797.t1
MLKTHATLALVVVSALGVHHFPEYHDDDAARGGHMHVESDAFNDAQRVIEAYQGVSRATLVLRPFDLSAVRLAEASRFDQMERFNTDFLMGLEDDRLTCLYATAANLSKTCVPYGHPRYFGHYLGHWLSATAFAVASATGGMETEAGTTAAAYAAAVQNKSAAIVATLAEAQAAWGALGGRHAGYLFPYPLDAFDNLFGYVRPGQYLNCAPVCVPFYVMHKVMAGMLDQYQHAGNRQALRVLLGMADWVVREVGALLERPGFGEAAWQQVLNTEWGGMNEVLYNLYAVTGNASHLRAGQWFNHFQWTAPLAIGVDDLDASHGNAGGNHANTHIPEIIGSARGYELTANRTQHDIASNFFHILNGSHTYATGGSNDHEHWHAPHRLGDDLDGQTEESCTTYNVLKVARHLLQWTADAHLADFYERALLNGLVGNQNQHLNGDGGSFIYMLPLGGGGLRKPWSSAINGNFPCCWGTLSETFAKLGDSVFFRAADDSALFVSLFVASSVRWARAGAGAGEVAGACEVTQSTAFPLANVDGSTTMLRVACDEGTAAARGWALRVRVPGWATAGPNAITVDGKPVAGALLVPGAFATVPAPGGEGGAWGTPLAPTTVAVTLPMSLRFEQLDDNRTEWAGVGAIMYGPLLLAGLTGDDLLPGLNASAARGELGHWIMRNDTSSSTAGTQLAFTARNPRRGTCGQPPDAPGAVQLMPLMDVQDEAYTAYFHSCAPEVPPSAPVAPPPGGGGGGAAAVPTGGAADWTARRGARLAQNGALLNIRSGDKGQDGASVISTHPVLAAAAGESAAGAVAAVGFAYRYVSGYGSNGTGLGANFTVSLADRFGATLAPVWSSPHLNQYPYDACHTCYSPYAAVLARVPAAAALPRQPLHVKLTFDNNDRNLQLDVNLSTTEFPSDFQGLGDGQYVLGKNGENGWRGSRDGGRTWSEVFQDEQGGIAGDAPGYHAVVTGARPGVLHNMGNMTAVTDRDAGYTAFRSSFVQVYEVAGGAFSTRRLAQRVAFHGLPDAVTCGTPQHLFGCPFRTDGIGHVALRGGVRVMTVVVFWGGAHASTNKSVAKMATSVVAFRSSDGYSWAYAGTVLDAAGVPSSEEGPNQNDLVLLADNRTIMCVMRVDSGEGPSGRYAPLVRSFSADGGFTWTRPETFGAGFATGHPRLARTEDGQVLLSSNQVSATDRDLLVYWNAAGDGRTWRPHSVSYWHNALEPDAALRFTPAVNSSPALPRHGEITGLSGVDADIFRAAHDRCMAAGPRMVALSDTRALLAAVQSLCGEDDCGGEDSARMRVGVLTSDDRAPTRAFIEGELGIHKASVIACVCGDDGKGHKPAAAPLVALAAELGVPPARTVLVGDSEVDVACAAAAGARSIAVLTGVGNAASLAGADVIIESVAGLSIARLKAKAAAARGDLWEWVDNDLGAEGAECVLPKLAKVVAEAQGGPRCSRASLSPIVPPGAEPPAFAPANFDGKATGYTVAMVSGSGKAVEEHLYAGRVLKFVGTEERHVGRRRVVVAEVRARWPQAVDFEKGEFVDKPEEEELVLWPPNHGARNKRDQVRAAAVPAVPVCALVVYGGKAEAEVDTEWAEGGECNTADLTAEMDEARTVAEALCAPAALS